jgi:hypothetical protein
VDEALEAKKGFVAKKLGQLRKSQLVTLARAFNLDVSEAMRKVDIIDEIVSSRLKEAYGFFVNLEKLKRGLTISQALKVATDVLGVSPSELINVKSKKDLLVLLYGKFGINQVSSKIDMMLDYANKLKGGRIVRHIRVITKRPMSFDDIISSLKEYQEEYNRNSVFWILVDTNVQGDVLNVRVHEEYSIKYTKEFDPYPSIKSKEYKPLKDLRLIIRKINDTEFDVIAHYRVDEYRKLGTHLLERIFPEASIEFIHKNIARDVTEKISDALLSVERIESLFDSFREVRDHTKNKVQASNLADEEKDSILKVLDNIELIGFAVNREDFNFTVEAKDFKSLLSKVSSPLLTDLLKQLVTSYGKEAVSIKMLINGKPVTISLVKGVEGTGLSEEEYRALEFFANTIKESL